MHYELVREYSLPTLKTDSMKQLDGYPPVANRWHIFPDEWDGMTGKDGCGLAAPYDGPSHIANHAWRDRGREKGIALDEPASPDNPVALTQLAPWDRHLERDTLGRPLHPLGRLGVTTSFGPNHTLGMYTGLGRFYFWGSQPVGNLGVRREQANGVAEYAAVVTMRSANQLRWSLPGGHARRWLNEGAEGAAFNEGFEEAGLVREALEGLPRHQLAMTPSLFGPNTLHAWLAESFTMINGSEESDLRQYKLHIHDTREIYKVAWLPAHVIINNEVDFMGGHRQAVAWLEASIAAERAL